MDYRELLSRPLSKSYIDEVVVYTCNHPDNFQQVFELIFDKDNTVAWRAAWACGKISELNPSFFSDKQIDRLSKYTICLTHGGVHRGCLSILLNLPLPTDIQVEFINACFDWMISPKFPIAVQALSMKMLCRICLQEPDFIPELKATLENIDYPSYSAGFNSTRRNILKRLNR